MATLADFEAKALAAVKDPSNRVSSADRQNFVKEAVREYSRHRPLVRVAEITGDGITQQFATPAGWVIGFSALVRAEWPIDLSPVRYHEGATLNDFLEVLRISHTVERIVTRELVLPASGPDQKLRIWYTAEHVVTTVSADDTTNPNDFDALANLAASKIALAIASFYSDTRDATLAADAVNHITRAAEFRAQAKQLRAAYLAHMGLKEGEVQTPVLRHFESDVSARWGRDLLFHRRRDR